MLALAACSKPEAPTVAPAAPAPPRAAAPQAKPAAPVATTDPVALTALLKQGEAIFENTCATCHICASGTTLP